MARYIKLNDMVLAECKLWGACPLTAVVAWRCRIANWAAAASISRGQVIVVARDWIVVFYLRHIIAASTVVAEKIVAASFRDVVDLVVDI